MKLTIGNEESLPSYKNMYEIEVKFMHGDADAYTEEYIMIPAEKIHLVEEVLDALNKFINFPWNDARKLYRKQVEYKIWFTDSYLGPRDGKPGWDKEWPEEATYERCSEAAEYSFSWPRDVTYEEIDARLEKFKVFYYDENGVKFNVNVEF